MRSSRSSLRNLVLRPELLAVATGLAGCAMMVLAFFYIIMYGSVVFIEPNAVISHTEFVVFVVGLVANIALGYKVTRR